VFVIAEVTAMALREQSGPVALKRLIERIKIEEATMERGKNNTF